VLTERWVGVFHRRLHLLLKGCSVIALIGAIAANCDTIRHLLVRGVAASSGARFGLFADCNNRAGPSPPGSSPPPTSAVAKGLLGLRQCELVRVDAVAVRALVSVLGLILVLHECDLRAVAVRRRRVWGWSGRNATIRAPPKKTRIHPSRVGVCAASCTHPTRLPTAVRSLVSRGSAGPA